ncbi:unnamed protein product [Danaus chrysippus]|uniref:(African queen) hypothetical protein n=1 Tax=Danaus chrysippus TaxID=151541 RepID=A0A8J2VUV6_9NEOP|nr:unnamed protein product [Danaus chrysippus]
MRKRPRDCADSGSESVLSDSVMPPPKVGAKKGGRGRPATTGKYVGIGQSRREAAAAMKAAAAAEKLEEDERQIAALTKRVMEGRVTRLSQSLSDAVAAIKRVSRVSKGLSGCSQKALKEATASILESAQVLLTRTTTEETALLRAQNAKLAAQMAELRKEHDELKEEMINFRREQLRKEVGLPSTVPLPQPQSQPSKQQSSQETEILRLIRQEMASFNARFSVLEGRILRPPVAADQRSRPATTNVEETVAAQESTIPTATSQKETAGPKSKKQIKKAAKLAKKADDTPISRAQTAESGACEPATRAEAEWTVAGAAQKSKAARQRAKKQAQKKQEAAKSQTSAHPPTKTTDKTKKATSSSQPVHQPVATVHPERTREDTTTMDTQ